MARKSSNDLYLEYESLSQERKVLDGQLELLERFVMPGRGRFFQEGVDDEDSIDWRHREIYDGVANNSVVLLASNVHGSLTSPSSTWFELRFRSEELNDSQEASEWLEDSAERIRASLQDSNFNLEVSEFYLDGAGFGTAVMLHNEQPGPATQWNGHQFNAEMLRQCYFEEDANGKPTAIFVMRSYTPMQMALRFGRNALPQRIIERLDNPNESTTSKDEEVIYCVYLDDERADANVSSILPPGQRPYVGRHVLITGREFIGEEDTFYELPGYVLRWQRTAGSKYGHCPGIISLGDILTLQQMVEMVRTSTEKTVDPPLKHTVRGVLGDVMMGAGELTAVRTMDDLQPLLPPGAYRIDAGWQDINDLRMRIEKAFFIDQLQLKESPQMTATEVQIRYEMMQRLLGPTLGRIQSDFLSPLIERSFWMLARKGALLPMPDIVKQASADLDIDYVGPLARAQRMSSVESVERWVGGLARLGEVAPEVMDLPDMDAIAKYNADVLGVPAKLVRSDAEVDKRREVRAQEIAQAREVEQAQGVAKAAKDMGQSGLIPEGGVEISEPELGPVDTEEAA